MKKLTAIFGSCLFFFVVMTMYLLLDQFQVTLDKKKFIQEVKYLSFLIYYYIYYFLWVSKFLKYFV